MRLLTTNKAVININSHSQKTSVRFETRENNGAGDSTLKGLSLFLRPKSVLAIARRSLFMVGGELERFRYTASQTSFLSHRPKFETFAGGLLINNGVSHMTICTQNTPKIQGKSQSKFDLFKHVNGVKTLVCCGLSSSQLQALLPELQGRYGLKFTGMMEG